MRLLAERFDALLDEVPSGTLHHDAAFRSLVAEFSAAGRLPSGAVENLFARAHSLVHHFPLTAQAFDEGDISARHVEVLISAAQSMVDADPAATAEFEAKTLPFARQETAARTSVHAKAVAAASAPCAVAERHRRARNLREVHVVPLADGMAQIVATVPELLARAAFDRLTSLARCSRGDHQRSTAPASHEGGLPGTVGGEFGPDAPDHRSLDQVRADVFVDLVLAARPETIERAAVESISATVQVTIAASTLAGDDNRLAELDGYGPVHSDFVRELARTSPTWNRLFLDPHGMAISTDNYAPTAAMRRLLRARDQHCRFPGCRAPVHRCDIDHNHDYARGGATIVTNLSHLCRRHHTLKHPDVDARFRWSATQSTGGAIIWRSPSGAEYIDEPALRVMFA